MQELIGVALRVSILYIYVLTLLRLSGKRSVQHISPLDLIVGLLIGDMFDDIFWAEIPLSQGLVGISTVIALHILVTFSEHKSTWLHHLVTGRKTVVVQRGNLDKSGMAKERTPETEVYAQMRIGGEDQLEEIDEAAWEPSGALSLLKKEAARKAQKKDLPLLKEALR